MEFQNKEAEDLFMELFEKYGLRHINADGAISVESLLELEKNMIEFLRDE